MLRSYSNVNDWFAWLEFIFKIIFLFLIDQIDIYYIFFLEMTWPDHIFPHLWTDSTAALFIMLWCVLQHHTVETLSTKINLSTSHRTLAFFIIPVQILQSFCFGDNNNWRISPLSIIRWQTLVTFMRHRTRSTFVSVDCLFVFLCVWHTWQVSLPDLSVGDLRRT
jgi:hypothetical protein